MKKLYGITLAQKQALVMRQLGLCAICKKEAKILHVDHNHLTGVIRGLLCGTCNRGLGLFKEDQEMLNKATLYLKKHEPIR